MRSTVAEGSTLVGAFDTGNTVTVSIYNLADNSLIINAAACIEIGATGVYVYKPALSPAGYAEYLWIMSDGIDQVAGVFELGGYPDTLLGDASSLRIDTIALKNDTYTLKDDTATIKADTAALKSDAGTLKNDTSTLKADIIDLKVDTGTLKADSTALKGDTAALKSDTAAIKQKTDLIDWADVEFCIEALGGNRVIRNNQLILYKSDGLTEIARFNLYDADGNPTEFHVYRRERV